MAVGNKRQACRGLPITQIWSSQDGDLGNGLIVGGGIGFHKVMSLCGW